MATKYRKKFRVASSGATIDGREIKPEWLKEAAANYDPNEYAARINIDHSRWSGAQGDVLALEAVEVDGRVDLFADIELNAHGKWVNENSQKLYSSIELREGVPGMDGMYVTGLAMTDEPASMRTERLQFSAYSRSKTVKTFDTELRTEEIKALTDTNEENPSNNWRDTFTALRDSLAGKFKAKDKDANALADEVRTTITEFADLTVQRIDLESKRADKNAADLAQLQATHTALAAEFQQLKSSLSTAPAGEQRPTSAGGQTQYQAAPY